ncbi:Peptidase S33, tripeptidyl-peptidase [Cordyceps javanica]|uniref:Peptidase S33, tripeptidyl-peptidase n=1 Tax=Cordyceps javanica TaxID=43265 RepID=A0A545VEY5_9HYPO|nr:Peptidase S33, tripeptidyl-peptidase [Cordyceps javanica]TQW11487.1 Peptidase S33, tripeptidyl-peptidase [Cordyceps javanica]
MVFSKTALPILLGLAAYAQAAPATSITNSTADRTNSSIRWGRCPSAVSDLSGLPVECAQYGVPLDYTNEKCNETAVLNLIRVPATKQPSLGSILLNYGGPGEESIFTTAQSSFVLNMFSGGRYDLVAFDPRGTTTTLPFTCFNSSFQQQRLMDNLSPAPQPEDREVIGHLWAAAGNFGQLCSRAQKKTGSLIGTAFTARDVVSVATALGEKDKIRFWGFSYGTTLGATLVSMFPEKIEGVILDGVQNPHEYYHADADFEEWTQSDQVFSAIFEHCAQNADKCVLSRRGDSSAELEKRYWSLYESLRYDPLPAGTAVLDNYALGQIASNALYSPYSWPNFTTGLDMLLGPKKDYDVEFLAAWTAQLQITDDTTARASQQTIQSLVGIHCSDRVNRLSSLEAYLPVQQRLGNISRVMGPSEAPVAMICAQWQIDAKERYKGNFQVAPRKPVLLVGNSYDGHTPIVSARNVSAGFKGSTVLEVNGYGHASLGLPSKCTVQKFAAYWVNGTMPEPGT